MAKSLALRVERSTVVAATHPAGYDVNLAYFAFEDEEEVEQFKRDMVELYPNFIISGPWLLGDPKAFIDRARSFV